MKRVKVLMVHHCLFLAVDSFLKRNFMRSFFHFPCTHFVLLLFPFIDETGGEEMDESVEEETRSNRSIGISKEKTKKKKKIRKVMSWNF